MENKRENEKQINSRMQKESVRQRIAGRMQENYRMWEQMGYGQICETSMEKIAKAASGGLYESLKKRRDKQQILEMPECLERYLENYGAVCQCYYLYRDLHERTDHDTKTAVLLGDYFFGEFSRYLIPIDSPKLIEIFSRKLQEETGQAVFKSRPFQTGRPETELDSPKAESDRAAEYRNLAKYANLEEYITFVERIPEQFAEELV